MLNPKVVSLDPSQLPQPVFERGHARLCLRVTGGKAHQHADPPHLLRLLRPGRDRPCGRRAAEQRDELAPPHSITSSARASSGNGTMTPSALAVLRLITSSTFADCWTGRSAGFS